MLARSPVNLRRRIMGKGSYDCKQFGATILSLGPQGTFVNRPYIRPLQVNQGVAED
jgi:hypothetical protein